MNLSASRATEADVARIVEIQFSAFEHDPYQEALFPGDYYSPELRGSACKRTLAEWRSDPSIVFVKCEDESTGTIVGFAKWNVYDRERPEAEWRNRPTVDWCEGRKKEVAENFLYMTMAMREKLWEGRPHLCTLLVQWGVDLAKEKRLKTYLEASPAGYHLYDRMGFRKIDVAVMKAEQWDGDFDRQYIAMLKD